MLKQSLIPKIHSFEKEARQLASYNTTSVNRAIARAVITFEITKEIRKQPPFWCTTRMSDILIMLLICFESDKIPLLHKLKQLYKRLPVGVLIDIAYTANNILYHTSNSR